MNLRSFYKYIFIFIVSLFVLTGCGGGSGGVTSGNSYSIENGNRALMGPLKDATVKVYKLTDLNSSIEEVQTGVLGKFDVSLHGISDSKLLLIAVSGGVDIDANDDGVIDKKPLDNKGVIHGYATAGDLKKGKVHITLISELIYQYTKQYIPKIGNDITLDDFKRIISYVARNFIDSKDDNEAFEKMLTFNPIVKVDKKELRFSYSKLVDGSGSLASFYHAGSSKKNIESKINNIFSTLPISLYNKTLLKLRDDYKVTFVGSNIDYDTTGFTLDSNNTSFVKKDSNITINITRVDPRYTILKWNGCDKISSDLKTCKLINVHNDRLISAIVVPSIKEKSGIHTIDISNAYADIDSNFSIMDKNVSLTLYSDLSDKTTKDLLATIKSDDIIIHKTEPVFFGKVVDISKINDFRYKVNMQTLSIKDVLSSGYISTSTDKIGASSTSSISSSRVLSRALILPNGKKIEFDPNKPTKITLDFKNNKILLRAVKYPYVEPIKSKDGGYEAIAHLTKNTEITGSLTLTPMFKYNIAWSMWSGLEVFDLTLGTNIQSSVTLHTGGGFKIDKNVNIANFTFTQTVMVGPFPVVFQEPISIYLGIDGNVKADAELGVDNSISPTIHIVYDKSIDKIDRDISYHPSSTFFATINGSEDTFAYLGVYPSFQIYGIGGGIDNKLGLYSLITGEAKGKVTSSAEDKSVKISAGLQGEYGFRYKGHLLFNTSWDILKTVISKINEKFSKNIEMNWTIGKFNYSSKYKKDLKIPGYIKVLGSRDEYSSIKINNVSDLNKNYMYTITNPGETNISFLAKLDDKSYFNTQISKDSSSLAGQKEVSGVLKPGESKHILLNINGKIQDYKPGVYNIKLNIYKKSATILPWERADLLSLPLFVSDIKINVIPDDLSDLEKTKLDVNISGSTIKSLTFSWGKYDSIGGYKIYMGDYNKSNDVCEHIRPFADSKKNNYSESLLALMKTGDKNRKIEPNKTYCFTVSGYKKYKTINGEILNYEKVLSNFSTITPIKVSEDINSTDTNTTLQTELDVMFLVDLTGSYGDDLATFRDKSLEMINALKAHLPKSILLKVGVTSFEDYPNSSYDSSSTDKPYMLDLNLTSDANKFKNSINNLVLGNGGDGPEAQLEGLYQTIKDPKVGWNNSAMKIIILFTDASFHDHDRDPDYPGHGSSEVKKLLSTEGISVIGIGSGDISTDLDNISNYTYLLNSSSTGVVNVLSKLVEAIPGSKVATSSRGIIKKVLPNPDFEGEPNN